MAHVRESFPILKDEATGAGLVVTNIHEGLAQADTHNAVPVSAFKDSNGNYVWPTLTPEGAFYVDSQTAGTKVWNRGAVALGSVNSFVDVVTIALDNGGTYTNLSFFPSCRTDTYFQVVLDNGTTQTVLLDAIVGPGQYTLAIDSEHFYLSVPGTGTNSLKVRGYNFETASQLSATFACVKTV